MRQKTCFSVVEKRSENETFVSENEGSDLGIPWPDGPPSSDCPVGWHADDAPRRHRVRDRYLPKTRECVWPFSQGFFMPPKTSPGVFTYFKTVFLKPRECVSPFPQGLFPPPKNTPLGFSVAKNTDFPLKPRSCGRQLPAALFYAP